MRRWTGCTAAALTTAVALATAATLAACDGDETLVVPRDAGLFGRADATSDGGDLPLSDGGAPDPMNQGDGGAFRMLATGIDFPAKTSELLVMDREAKRVDGRLTVGSTDALTTASGDEVFLLERDRDVVTRLDPAAPWRPLASWDVRAAETPDAGGIGDGGVAMDGGAGDAAVAIRPNANPSAVVVLGGGKAYVLRYNRNAVAVLDTAYTGDAGAATRTIDLSAQLQPADRDGTVEMTAGIYVASRRLVYVVLQNVDQTTLAAPTYYLRCTGTRSTVVAIDVDTDTLVDLNGAAAGVELPLMGVNPTSVAYDPTRDRLLLAHGGCYASETAGDGTTTDVARGRMIEELSLFTGGSRSLLDTTILGYPDRFVFIDDRRAVLRFLDDRTSVSTTYLWDPSTNVVGRTLDTPEAFAYDGAGQLVGLRKRLAQDGGVERVEAVMTRIADGRETTLMEVPFTNRNAYVQSLELWRGP